MARANWVKGATTTGGTGSLTLTAVTGYPTFAMALGTGETTVSYTIVSSGLRESGTATFNGTTNVLSGRTVIQSWNGTVYGTSAQNFPTSGVEVFCAPVHQEVATLIPATGLLTTSHVPAFTGDVTNTAGSLALTIADEAVTAAKILEGGITLDRMAVSTFPADAHTHALGDLTDFDVDTPVTGQLLQYDGTDWVNANPDLAAFADVEDITGVDGDVLLNVSGVWEGTPVTDLKSPLALPASTVTGGLAFTILDPEAATYPLCIRMPYAGTITFLDAQTDTGTITANLKINSTSVTSVSAVGLTSSLSNTQATAANAVASGDAINLTLTSPSGSPGYVTGVVRWTRS
jgi:hypothetical protein